MELGRIMNFDITISPSHNKGFIAKVGCGQFVFESKDTLLKAMEEYLSDPKKWEKEYGDIGGSITAEEVPTVMRPTDQPEIERPAGAGRPVLESEPPEAEVPERGAD